jgi:hypothetical protein
MTVKKRISRMVGLTADIVKTADAALSECEPSPGVTSDEIKRLWGQDYGNALRTHLSRAEIREIVREAKRTAWPHLNDSAVRLGSMKEFAERASALGADFRIAKMPWPSGLALFGFYLGKDSGLEKRPLICLNGAHHPAAVATAFLHEVGHHITAELFSTRKEMIQLSRQTGHEAHLNDARELAADILVSLGLYPRKMASQLFGSTRDREISSASEGVKSLPPAAKAVLGTAQRYGLDFERLPIQKRLQYQAGLIHFTRLREALLDEYGL